MALIILTVGQMVFLQHWRRLHRITWEQFISIPGQNPLNPRAGPDPSGNPPLPSLLNIRFLQNTPGRVHSGLAINKMLLCFLFSIFKKIIHLRKGQLPLTGDDTILFISSSAYKAPYNGA